MSACTPGGYGAIAGGWLRLLTLRVCFFTSRDVMKSSLVAQVLVCAALCGCAGAAPKSSDQANLQGTWLAQSESQNGQKKDVAYQYVFRGDKLSFKDETGKEVKYSFKLETASKLKLITIRPAEIPASSAPVSVAYELDGDSLKLVIAPAGSRPTGISDKNDQELIVCKRKTP